MLWRRLHRFRVRSLMMFVAAAALLLGALAESSRAQRRWAWNRQAAGEHSQRARFYTRTAERFEELAQLALDRENSEHDQGEIARHHSQAELLKRTAAAYRKNAAVESRMAREVLTRW